MKTRSKLKKPEPLKLKLYQHMLAFEYVHSLGESTRDAYNNTWLWFHRRFNVINGQVVALRARDRADAGFIKEIGEFIDNLFKHFGVGTGAGRTVHLLCVW